MSKGKISRPETLEQACGLMIARRRESLGFSQMDLAVAAGYSLRYIGDVERGTKSPTLRTLNDVATFLEVGLGRLITDAEEMLGRRTKSAKPFPQSRILSRKR